MATGKGPVRALLGGCTNPGLDPIASGQKILFTTCRKDRTPDFWMSCLCEFSQ